MRYSKSIADKLVQDDIIQETDKIVVEFGLRQLFAVLRSLSIVKNGIWTITMSYYKQFMNC